MNLTKVGLEKLAVALLDDDHGINEKGWCELEALLEQVDSLIPNMVKAQDGRYYLGTEKVLVCQRRLNA